MVLSVHFPCHRICSSNEDVREWKVRVLLLRWEESTGAHPRKNEEESLGGHGRYAYAF